MSVHELKRPPALQSPQPETVSIFPAALEQLRHWAQVSPLQSALRHKRHGQWHSWRWIDTLREVERLADGLRQHGFTADSRLALSGSLEPNLLLLSLAAHSIGGEVFSLAPELTAEALGQAFWRLQPSHGFVDSRQQLLDWLAVGDSNTAPGVLIANQLPGRLPSLCGELQEPRPIVLWRAPTTQPQLWSEEDTRWQGGLGVVLEQWLNSGHGLAFAESRDSASRDRREVAPSGLLLSPERLQNLADEIEQRLAPRCGACWGSSACNTSGSRAPLRSCRQPSTNGGSRPRDGKAHECGRADFAGAGAIPVVQGRESHQCTVVRR